MPPSKPDAGSIVATGVLSLLHVPPATVLLRVVVVPEHNVVTPVIADGGTLTVSTVVVVQPADDVNVIVVVPGAIPPAMPVAAPIVATPVAELLHVPVTPASVSVVVPPTHIVVIPVIGTTGFTVIVFVAVAVMPHASVTVTVYTVVAVGDTVAGEPVAPPGVHTMVYGGTP